MTPTKIIKQVMLNGYKKDIYINDDKKTYNECVGFMCDQEENSEWYIAISDKMKTIFIYQYPTAE